MLRLMMAVAPRATAIFCFSLLVGLLVGLRPLAARAQAPAPAPPEPAPQPATEPATVHYVAQLTGAYATGAVERTLLNTSHAVSYARGRHFGAPLSASFIYGKQARQLKERETLLSFTPYYRLERFRAYAVGAYERSNLRGIAWRTQVGAGPGWAFYRNETGTRELALSNLFLNEATEFVDGTARRLWRSSARLKLTYGWGIFNLSSSTFYQPRVAHAEDYRVSNATTLKLSVTRRLAVTVATTYSYEQRVIEARSRGNTNVTVGVSYSNAN